MGGFFCLNFNQRSLLYNIMKNTDELYIVYFSLSVDKKVDYKTIIKSSSIEDSKSTLRKKISKDYMVFELSNVRSYLINKNNYRGRKLSDKQIDLLNRVSYPNTKNKLYKFKKDNWFKTTLSKSRNHNGTFKKGFTPWNKNLKIEIGKRDKKGKFVKGNKSLIVGSKDSNEKET